MRAYIIDPPFDGDGVDDERTRAATDLTADILTKCLRGGGDTFHYAVVWANPGEEPDAIWDEDIAQPHLVKLDTEELLREWLRKSIDPNRPGGWSVRSVATCRCVTFGYDGQALLCLRHEDQAPVSPDPSLAVVEERSDLLAGSDYFDGWIGNNDS
jgi:hypothetical protein